jgi:hypothetical protein
VHVTHALENTDYLTVVLLVTLLVGGDREEEEGEGEEGEGEGKEGEEEEEGEEKEKVEEERPFFSFSA